MAEKNTKPVQGPGGRGPKGPRPKVENPGKLFMRLLAYIMKNYAVHCILVVICIFITVLASVQGTWFMQTLIDGYILPLIGQADPDFSGLLHAIMRVSIFYLIGALASYIYTRNLCFPIALHWFWNWIQGPVLGYEVSGNKFCNGLLALRLPEANLINGGAFGFEGSILCTVLMVVGTGLILKIHGKE